MTPVLVLYINPYDFTNDRGEQVRGMSLEYLDLEQDPTGHAREGTKGLTVFKDTLEAEAVRDFKEVPGFYQLSHKQTRDAKGRPTIRVTGGTFVSGFDTSKLMKVSSSNN